MRCALHQPPDTLCCVDASATLRAQADRLPLHEAAANQASEEVVKLLLIDGAQTKDTVSCLVFHHAFEHVITHARLSAAHRMAGFRCTLPRQPKHRKR